MLFLRAENILEGVSSLLPYSPRPILYSFRQNVPESGLLSVLRPVSLIGL
jgi:hypothetical protein